MIVLTIYICHTFSVIQRVKIGWVTLLNFFKMEEDQWRPKTKRKFVRCIAALQFPESIRITQNLIVDRIESEFSYTSPTNPPPQILGNLSSLFLIRLHLFYVIYNALGKAVTFDSWKWTKKEREEAAEFRNMNLIQHKQK